MKATKKAGLAMPMSEITVECQQYLENLGDLHMTATQTFSLFEWKFSLKLAFLYILAKLKFVHGWLPEKLREQLPTGWNNQMFWVAFKSGGQTLYFDYYCRLKEPKFYKPRVSVAPEFQLTEEQIRGFYL
ncbi:hypothetical protein QUA35_05440 [Microcoleus sp. N9_B2]|uniref:hypothetical protein n=1 Tax=unclassified Microcoleus TaxID=2642155 RepID=UPI002FD009E3